MPPWLWIVIVIALLASRPIEARLWRAGRISDQTAAILLLSRFPLLALIFVVAQGASLPIGAFVLGVSLLPAVIGYRWVLRTLREQALHARTAAEIPPR